MSYYDSTTHVALYPYKLLLTFWIYLFIADSLNIFRERLFVNTGLRHHRPVVHLCTAARSFGGFGSSATNQTEYASGRADRCLFAEYSRIRHSYARFIWGWPSCNVDQPDLYSWWVSLRLNAYTRKRTCSIDLSTSTSLSDNFIIDRVW